MPVALRSFGLKLNTIHRKRTEKLIGGKARLGGKLRRATDRLDGDLVVLVHRLASQIFVDGKISKQKWRKVRRQVIKKDLPAVYRKFDDMIEEFSDEVQILAFSDTGERLIEKFDEIYPIKRNVRLSKKEYRKHVKKLNFIDSELELKFLTGREVTQSDISKEIKKTKALIEAMNSESDDRRDPPSTLVVGTGQLDDDFDLFAEGQESAGLSPIDLLAGLSSFNLGNAQKNLIRSTRKGIENGWSRKTFVTRAFNSLAKSPERTSLVKGAMGVMKGAHQRAAAAATSLFSLFNRKKINALMRVTSGGRSCIACIVLDGTLWPLGSTISDHRNGGCTFVPVAETYDDLGLERDEVPVDKQAKFKISARSMPNMKSKFLRLSEAEQRKVFGNKLLFDFWKREKFPLEKLVVNKNGTFVPTSFKEVSKRIESLGGLSFPKASIGFQDDARAISEFMRVVDPLDRARSSVLVRVQDLPSTLFRESKFGIGFENILKAEANILSKANEFIRFHAKGRKVHWNDINEYYRTLGLHRRVDINGKTYFSISRSEFDLLEARLANAAKKAAEAEKIAFKISKTTDEQKKIYNEFLKLDTPSAKEFMKFVERTPAQAIEEMAQARLKLYSGKTSHETHFNKKTGSYSRKRKKLHEKIAREMAERGRKAKAGEAEILMTGGYPGSGKSTMLDGAIPGWRKKYSHIDSDQIKVLLAKADGHDKLAWRASLYQDEARGIALRAVELARLDNRHILFDGTMDKFEKYSKLIKEYKEIGYSVRAAFSDLPVTKSMERAVGRFLGEENRFIDPLYILSTDGRAIASFEKLKPQFDDWVIYNTDVARGAAPIRMRGKGD